MATMTNDRNLLFGVVAEPARDPEPFAAPKEEAPLAERWSQGVPSKPLLGVLPLARTIPQDVHSVLDYLNAGTVLAAGLASDCPEARATGLALGAAGAVASSLTDYRLSVAKVVPIETHEVVDYTFAAAAIAAPFVLGYYKTAPVAAAVHVATGLGVIAASLFTDYRAYRGVGRR